MSATTYSDVAGYRHHSRARSTGTVVILVDAYEQALESPDMDGHRWFLTCVEHNGCCGWPTQSDARTFMSAPEQWCPICSGDETEADEADEVARLEAELENYVAPTCGSCGSVYLIGKRCIDCGQNDARPIPGERWTDLPDVCGAIANVRGGVLCCGYALGHPGRHLDSSWGRYWSDETV